MCKVSSRSKRHGELGQASSNLNGRKVGSDRQALFLVVVRLEAEPLMAS